MKDPFTPGIHVVEIQRRDHPILAHHKDTSHQFQGAAGRHGMPQVPLETAYGNGVSEEDTDGLAFGRIALDGGGSMRVYIINRLGFQACIFETFPHTGDNGPGIRVGDVGGIRLCGKSDDFS